MEESGPHDDAFYRLLVEYSRDAIILVDATGTATFASPACSEVLGLEPDELVGRSGADLVHPEDLDELIVRLAGAFDPASPSGPALRCRMRTGLGEYRWMEIRSQFAAPDARLGGVVVNIRDAHEQVTAELAVQDQRRHLAYLAEHDPLTGLANRAALIEHLEECCRGTADYGPTSVLLYLDLDHFKAINDRHGHLVGDGVLVETARRMRACVRVGDLIARIGGDEFVVLCARIGDSGAEAVLERLLAAIPEPMVVEETIVTVTMSIGVTRLPLIASADAVIAAADAAMYRAKRSGRNRWVGHADTA